MESSTSVTCLAAQLPYMLRSTGFPKELLVLPANMAQNHQKTGTFNRFGKKENSGKAFHFQISK